MDKEERLKDWRQSNMPDFNMKKIEPYAKIIFRFDSQKDLSDFSELIGQKLTSKTKSSWFPFKPHKMLNKKEWVSE